MTETQSAPWSDSPRAKTDITGRPAFASAVAARINATAPGSNSTVFGLVGPWGSGKTTLLQDIVSQLAPQIVWFSPWSAADVAAITAEFVSALSEAFPKAESLKTKLVGYARFGVPALRLIPTAGEAVSGVAQQVLATVGAQPAWHSEFKVISDEIAKQGKQVVVVVDDVDRLDADELRALLRVVRLLGRFTNVHYLLAYDQATIDQLLAASDMGGRSSDFMEKIVQYPFEVPPIPTIERRRWSRTIVSLVVDEDAQQSDELNGPTDDLIRILAAGIETPRAAERLREQLGSFSDLAVQAELDGLDFIAISWLRIAHHEVWDFLRTHAEAFQGWVDTDDEEAHADLETEIEKRVQRGNVKAVWNAVEFLFGGSSFFAAKPGRLRQMRQARYFDRYFLIGLADDDISDIETQKAVDQLVAGSIATPEVEAFSDLIMAPDGERASLALQVGSDAREGDRASLDLVTFLWARRAVLKEQGRLEDYRQSPLERWLARELALALASGVMSTEDAIDRFDYEFLAATASGVRRSERKNASLVKEAYAGVANHWIAAISRESLDDALARPELMVMLSLCAWLKTGVGAGVLEPFITSTEDLLRVAEAFVVYSTSYGYTIEYNVGFSDSLFRFAVGNALTDEIRSTLPPRDASLEYEVEDRATRDLSPAELRDFILRSLGELGA
jgi:hypothetical protein